MSDNVSKDLTYLVTKDRDVGTSKTQTAKKYRVPILSIEEFKEILEDGVMIEDKGWVYISKN